MSRKSTSLALAAMLALAASSKAAVIFTEDFEDASATVDAQWASNIGTPAYNTAPISKGTSFEDADGATVRIGHLFSTNAAATSFKLTWDMYSNSNVSSQRYYGQLSNGTVALPGSGTGQFSRIAANNDAASKYDFLYSNGATTTVATPTVITVGWHTMSIIMTPGAANVGSYTYQIDNNTPVTIVSTGAVLAPTNVQLGQNVSNGTAGAPDTSAWFDNIKVEQFAPAASKASLISPANGAADIDALATTLNWTPGASNLTSQDVYFGTDSALTAAGDLKLSGTGKTTSTYNPGTLLPLTTYYWEVVEKNTLGDGTTADIWSFTTGAIPEPTSLGLLATGALLAARRRRA